jgi:starch synthase
MNILFATSEVFPLIKTGGLADVSYNLPAALHQLDHHVGIVLPAYHSLLPMLDNATFINSWQYGEDVAEIWHTTFGPDDLPLWLVHCPKYFDRKGGPYSGYEQQSWSDNALRFGFYCRVIAAMAAGEIDLGLRFDILHCNDWQTGLAPVFLSLYPTPKQRPLTVFTIHNLAYQGVFPRDDFEQLKLPETLWQFSQLEFHGQFSFIKGGIGFADQIYKSIGTTNHVC